MTDASWCNETEMSHVSTKDKLIYFRKRFTIKPKYRMKIRPIFCSCLRHQVTPLAWSKIQVQKNNGLLLMVISWNIYNIQYVPPLVQEELPKKNNVQVYIWKEYNYHHFMQSICSSSCKESCEKQANNSQRHTCISLPVLPSGKLPPNQHEPYPWFNGPMGQ